MRQSAIFSGLIILILLTGCAQKQTTVILLPQENQKIGAVLVQNEKTSVLLNQPYTAASATSSTADLKVITADAQKIQKDYAPLFEAEPAKPISFLLYFEAGSTRLTQASLEKLPLVIKRIKERAPCEITIIGHTDTRGTADLNARLSLKRAREVSKILKTYDPGVDAISVQGYGENDLLIPTQDNVSESRNRRVEIMIR